MIAFVLSSCGRKTEYPDKTHLPDLVYITFQIHLCVVCFAVITSY